MTAFIYISTLKKWLTKPIYYLFILAFFGMAGVAFVGNSGAIDGLPFNGVKANSSYEIHYLIQYFNKFLLFLIPAILGGIAYEDFKDNTYKILYGYPIAKWKYLIGKFCGGLTLVSVVVLALYLGIFVAERLPLFEPEALNAHSSLPYVKSFFTYSFLNIVFYGFATFCLVLYSRNYYVGFVFILSLFLIQNITQNSFDGNGNLISLLDPTASNSFEYVTTQWNVHKRNTLTIPIEGAVLYNRLFWGMLTLIFGVITLYRFRFRESGVTLKIFKNLQIGKGKRPKSSPVALKTFPTVIADYSLLSQCKTVFKISSFHFKAIITSKMFLVLVSLGLLAVSFAIGRVTNSGAITVLPTTNVVLTIPTFFFSTVIMLITFLYGGLIINKEKTHNVQMLVAASPIETTTLFVSKLIALLQLQVLLLSVMLIVGVGIQLYNGYYNIQLPLYLLNLFVIQFFGLFIWAIMSVTVHSIVRNTYLGIFLLLLVWIGVAGIQLAGVSSYLLLFNFSEPLQYSDVSGYNGMLSGYFLVKSYWLFFSLLVLCFAYLWFVRGNSFSLKDKLKTVRGRINAGWSIAATITSAVLLIIGFQVGREMAQMPMSAKDENKAFNSFEEKFKPYNKILSQPSITDIDLKIDIFEEKNLMLIEGVYTVQNKTNEPIDTLLIKSGFNEISTLKIGRPNKLVERDSFVDFSVFGLSELLLPGEQMNIEFTLKSKPVSIFSNNSKALRNGTFIKNDIFPRFGYFLNDSLPNPDSKEAFKNSYHGQGADLVNVHTILSNNKGLKGIAPGKQIKEWSTEDRDYFEFQTEKPVRNALSFHSGDFQVQSFKEDEAVLNIYYDALHSFNIEAMQKAFFTAIQFNTQHFGKPKQNEFNIVEFPMNQGTYATLMGTNIPTSEMRFVANNKDKVNEINLSAYVIAHEITHHWFGKQMTPAKAKGATLLTEGITEYLTLQIFKELYGINKANLFLEKQHRRYWEGSFRENEKEPPLTLSNPAQQYLTYGKTAVVLNALGHHLGHDEFIGLIGTFFSEYAMKTSYPTSLDFIQFLKENTADKWHALLSDVLEQSTSYTPVIKSHTISENERGFKVDFQFVLNRLGRIKEEVPSLEIPVTIHLYDEDNVLLFKSTEFVTTGSEVSKELFVTKKPYKIIIDESMLLLLKERDDNTRYLY